MTLPAAAPPALRTPPSPPAGPRRLLRAILLAASLPCGGAAAAAAAAAPNGCGTVVVPADIGVGPPSPPTTLDPALYTSGESEAQLMQLLFRPLVRADRDFGIDPDAGLAAAIDVSPDRTVFTVTLKPWNWSDGSPVTARDVVLDWDEIRALGPAYSEYGIGGVPKQIRAVEALDAHRVRFALTGPVTPGWFELLGLSQFYALPSADWGRLTLAQQQSRQTDASFYRLSDGPFLLERFEVGRFAAFARNPRYGGHVASIRRFVVDFLAGADPLQALASGGLDMADLPYSVWKAADDMPRFRRVEMGPADATDVIIPNLRSPTAPFLAATPVRQALAMAIDQRRLIDTVFHGHGDPVHGFVPTALTRFLPPELQGGGGPLGYDPARAAALLDRAGFRAGPDGVRAGPGGRLDFEVLTTAGLPAGLEMLQLIQADLAAVGVRMRIHEVEFNQLIARMLGPPSGWDAAFLSYTTNSYPDGAQFFSSTSSGNFERFDDPAMDRLLEQATTEPGLDGLFAVERLAVAQQPILFLPSGSVTLLVRPGIGGIDRFVQPNGNLSPEFLTLSKALSCDDANPPS